MEIPLRIPRYGTAVLEGLQFPGIEPNLLRSLKDGEWNKLLGFCDAAQLTLTFGHFCRTCLPDWVQDRVARNYHDHAVRSARLGSDVVEILQRFTEQGIDCVLLKGATHSPDFTPDPSLRSTGDIDLWCRPEVLIKGRDELLRLGYRPIGRSNPRHLPTMARVTEWQWHGDYYATDLPIPIDLHYKLWDERFEHIPGLPEDEVWSRRSPASIHGGNVQVLARADALAFAALHLLKHILHGDLRLQRAWEIGYFLNSRTSDESFWLEWKQLHDPALRKLEVLVFALVNRWFGCRLPQLVHDEAKALPQDVKLWIQKYAFSPVEALFTPNKRELWLNLCLIESFRGKVKVFLRRMLPIHAASLQVLARRSMYHARTLPLALIEGVKWWWIRQAVSRQ